MARLPTPNADTDQWGSLLNEFLRVAHYEDGTLRLDEVDATTLGVVPDSAAAAAANSQRINAFFAPTGSGKKLVLPAGTVYIDGTIDMVNRLNAKNSLSLRGQGIGTTFLHKTTGGCLIKLAGFFNYVGDLTLDGANKTALCGLYVQGYPQPGVSVPSKLNTFRNLRITGCRVGIRVGHYSDLDGDLGDRVNPDIVANHWHNIQLDSNRYGLIRDGQNILNDHFENFFCADNDRYHVYLPFGGDFRCFTAQFGATLEPGDYPKIYSFGAGPIILMNARSENAGAGSIQPPFLRTINAQTFLELHEVVVTNDVGASNLDIDLQGGRATLINCHVNGTVKLSNTQYIGLNNEIGAYNKLNVSQNNTIILDAAIGTKEGSKNTDAHLELTELTVKRTGPTGQNGAKIHFSSSGILDSGDGAFYFCPAGTATQSQIGLSQRPLGDGSAQGLVSLKNTAGKAVIATDGLNGGAAGKFEIQIAGRTVFSVDGNGNMVASGTKSAVVSAGAYGQRKLYAVESPQNWFEDFGTGQLVNGTATVAFDPTFAETINLDAQYHVFLMPLADHPLYVAEKNAKAFSVRAVGGATCNLAFDYRIVALRKGFEHVRLAAHERANG